MSAPELRPCPLCGGNNLDQYEASEGEESEIECKDCNLVLGFNRRRPPEQSRAAWNTRTPDHTALLKQARDALDDLLLVSNSSYYSSFEEWSEVIVARETITLINQALGE